VCGQHLYWLVGCSSCNVSVEHYSSGLSTKAGRVVLVLCLLIVRIPYQAPITCRRVQRTGSYMGAILINCALGWKAMLCNLRGLLLEAPIAKDSVKGCATLGWDTIRAKTRKRDRLEGWNAAFMNAFHQHGYGPTGSHTRRDMAPVLRAHPAAMRFS
jgi:hypothetical protein